MMQSEFEKLTGMLIPGFMYKFIEDEYMASEEDKKTFCKRYVADKDGLATKIQRLSNDWVRHQQEAHAKALTEYAARIHYLEKALEKEEEWQVYSDNDLFKHYDDYRQDCDEMSVDKAKKFIADTFGFSSDKIAVLTTYPQEEINRHGMIRKTAIPLDRKPLYDATDYNYILFVVNGTTFECIDGELYIIKD